MDLLKRTSVVMAAMGLAACVTINVYFPAAQAQEAADEVIEDVWGMDDSEQAADDAVGADGGTATLSLPGSFAYALLEVVVPVAHAAANLEVNSPAARQIIQRMERRFGNLRRHFNSGAVGLTNDALLAIRDLNAVPLPQRNQVRQLVAEQNADRNALYREIARANNHPEWEAEIRQTFARRWIANARSGWYYQGRGGRWQQK